MRRAKKRILSMLLVLVTLLSLLTTTALAANSTGTGIAPTTNNDRWTTRLTADGQSYAYKPPMAAGKYLYCMDYGYSYRSGTESFLNSYTYWSATGTDADALWTQAIAKTGLGEMDAITRENVKWMMSYIADYTGDLPGSLHMALQTYIWDNQTDKSAGGDPSGDIDAGGFANADTYDTYVGYYNWMLGQKANEDAELQAQVEAYAQQGIQATIVEDESTKWAVLATSSVSGRQAFFNYHVDRKVVTDDEPLPDDNPPPVAGDGDIVFRKVQAGTTRGLDGAVYNIYRDGQIIGSDVTSGGGYIYVNDVTTALYTFVERESPDGYALDPKPHSVYVDVTDGDKQYSVTASNRELPGLKIVKQDAQTYAEVSAVFEVESITGSYSTTVTVNGSKTLNDLEPGVYRITEKSVEEPYILNATERVVALLPGDGVVEEVFTNYQKPGLEILKRNIANPSEPIPNVTYTIEQIDGDYKTTATTDSKGRIYLELPEGSYEITETSVPSNVILCNVPQVIALGPGESRTVRFFNAYKPSLTIRKLNSITKDPIPNTPFRIVWASDNTTTGQTRDLGTFYTNAQGEIILTDDALLSGWYEVTEENPVTGFAIVGEATQRFYLGPDESTIKVWENRPLSAISVFKYDEKTGAALENAVFQIRYLDGVSGTQGTVIGEYTTSKNGTFTVTGLKSGTYIVEEIQSSPFYSINQGPETVLLTGDEQQVITLRFGNTPYGSAIIKKMSDDENQTPLEGAVFLVTDEKGTFLGNANGEFTTGRDGTVQLPMVPAGTTLVAREIKAPAGYALTSEPQTAYISAGEVHTFRFFDLPLCNLTVLKRSSLDQSPLEGATFLVKDSEGRPIGPNNGLYQTGRDGTFVVTGLTPNSTIIVSEETAPVGYIRDATPQTIVVRSGEPNGLIFDNDPAQTLVLKKYIYGTNNEPLEGVGFKVTDGNGAAVGPNTVYYTNDAGEVVLTGLEPGMTVIAQEISTVDGYILDGTPQHIQIKAGVGVQHLTFWNKAIGGVEIIKVSSKDNSTRLANATFEIRRVSDDALIDTVTSGSNGSVFKALEDGSYYCLETAAPKGFRLNPERHQFTITNGSNETVKVANDPVTGLIIHKVSSVDGSGIPNVSFIIYDSNHNPIEQVTTDQRGYAYVDDLGITGRVYLREVEAEGYIRDTDLKSVYLRAGETTEITWENTPITGQIQIWKKSADDNPINGFPAGTALEGAVFEIYDKSNRLVDTVKSNRRGLAVSKALPLGRYTVKEVSSAAFYSVSGEEVTVYLEHEGQIVQIEFLNKSVYTNVSVSKSGYAEVVPGQSIRYTFKDIANNSTVSLNNFYWRDTLPTDAVRLDKIITGTWSARLNYRVVFRTNINSTYRTLADNLSTAKNNTLDASPAALGLASNEYITEFMFVFGNVPAGFTQLQTPYVYCNVLPGLSHEYRFTNKTDVGGMWNSQWIMANDRWVTIVYNKTTAPTLPRTGY